jgi:hypothetical protein
MKDLIDLGNLVFTQLVKEHGEIEESRTLFLYGVTSESIWHVLNSAKHVTVGRGGVSYNFEDSVLAELHKTWSDMIQQAKQRRAQEELKKMKGEQKQFRDGDTFQFWQNEEPWREINF